MARRLLGSLVVLAFGAVLLPAGAAAAPGLASDDHAFPAPVVDSPDIAAAFAPNGFAAVAWIEQIAISVDEYVVNVAVRPPGQDWSAPAQLTTRLSQADPPSGRTLRNVQVAVNASGDVAVAWEETKTGTRAVAVSSRLAGGEFRKPELFDPGMTPLVGVDASGEVTFVYGFDTAASDGEVLRTAPAGASLAGATAQPLSNTCGAFEGDLAVTPSGDAILGWDCNGSIKFTVRRNGALTTSTPFVDNIVTCPTIATSTSFVGVRVDMDGEGHPVGVVQRADSTNSCGMFPITTRSNAIVLALPAGGMMVAGPEVAESGTGSGISGIPNDVVSPTVGIGGGSVVVEWLSGDNNQVLFRPDTRTYPDNGTGSPGPPQPIGFFGTVTPGAEVGVDAAGGALVTWIQNSAADEPAEFAAFRTPGGSFGQPLPVSDPSGDVTATSSDVSDQGEAVIAFLQGPTPGRVAHARGFDATPPQLSGVSIPATARAGVAASFGAGALDVWGPVSFAWDFGDGTAAGANPKHAFSSAGQKSVTVTATDSAGNSASQSGGVRVRRSAPRLTKVSASHTVFRVGGKPTAIGAARRAPVGTTFRFSLDRPASVAIKIARALPGSRSGKRCVKPTRRLARKTRCTRLVRRGTLRRHGKRGANRVAFSGRIGRRALGLGKHRASFVATAGGVSSKASVLRLRIVR